MMQVFGRSTLAELFGDWVVYRSLEPLDKRVPGFKSAAWKMGLTEDHLPRKQEIEYAKAATWILNEAQQVRGGPALRELLFMGDTLFNDGQAFRNMANVAGWKGSCFIGVHKADQEPTFSVDETGTLYNANRWEALADWLAWTRANGMALNERTAVVVDIDKTALGAKGRNDQVIDRARLEGIFRTMSSVLGSTFDQQLFIKHYAELNRSRYHFLTADNQDYLAYICLMLNAGLVSFDELTSEIASNSIENFDQFIRLTDSRTMINETTSTLLEVHESVLASVRVGDPTPFKRFRRQEFICTVEHMGCMPDSATAEEILDKEITLTEEVFQASQWLQKRGCFLLCLSDKPDEASRPSKGQTAEYAPIHRAQTHRAGTDIRAALEAIG